MTVRPLWIWTALGTALILGGCMTKTAPVHVTKADLGQPIPRGEVVIEPNVPTPSNSPQFIAAAGAVGPELTRLGFHVAVAPSSTSELIAIVDYTRVDRPAVETGNVPNGQTPAPMQGARPFVETTALVVNLRRRSDQSVIWQGRASIDTRVATPATVGSAPLAPELAAAVFKGFAAAPTVK